MFGKGFRSRSDRKSSILFAIVVGVGSGYLIFQQNLAREASLKRIEEKKA
jgi:hypothetical protein|tara:strand:- start:409 stop:558 length:150 start_codon:yes stop_codon:yes gene_type:complete